MDVSLIVYFGVMQNLVLLSFPHMQENFWKLCYNLKSS